MNLNSGECRLYRSNLSLYVSPAKDNSGELCGDELSGHEKPSDSLSFWKHFTDQLKNIVNKKGRLLDWPRRCETGGHDTSECIQLKSASRTPAYCCSTFTAKLICFWLNSPWIKQEMIWSRSCSCIIFMPAMGSSKVGGHTGLQRQEHYT